MLLEKLVLKYGFKLEQKGSSKVWLITHTYDQIDLHTLENLYNFTHAVGNVGDVVLSFDIIPLTNEVESGIEPTVEFHAKWTVLVP